MLEQNKLDQMSESPFKHHIVFKNNQNNNQNLIII